MTVLTVGAQCYFCHSTNWLKACWVLCRSEQFQKLCLVCETCRKRFSNRRGAIVVRIAWSTLRPAERVASVLK
jgi:hypothetical protein